MIIDPTSSIGKIRLRIGDWSDVPVLPDSVIQSALDESDGNVPRSAKLCAQYVLATLTSKTHRKMGLQLEVWGAEAYRNYKDFILLTIKDPSFMDISPIPYSASGTEINPLIEFQQSWNKNYYNGTQSQQLSRGADISPNDGTRTGGF